MNRAIEASPEKTVPIIDKIFKFEEVIDAYAHLSPRSMSERSSSVSPTNFSVSISIQYTCFVATLLTGFVPLIEFILFLHI